MVYGVCVALNRAGREAEALHLIEQLAENAINEMRFAIHYRSSLYILLCSDIKVSPLLSMNGV